MIRKIVRIDQELCDGCGLCVPSCAEGAIRIVDGKAVLAAENLCDGLGACLGQCPKEAITVEEREAEDFDEAAVAKHLGGTHEQAPSPPLPSFACPGSASRRLTTSAETGATPASASRLGNWPVQLHLVNPAAPWLVGADLLVAADCVPFAMGRFHDELLVGKVLLVGCPKLDDVRAYKEKLAEIFVRAEPRSVTVARMEVPCCGGLPRLVREAMAAAGRDIPVREIVVGIPGR